MANQQLAPMASPLAAVGDVALRLAAGDDVVRKTAGVLERVVAAFGVTECSLWLARAGSHSQVARSGVAPISPDELLPWADTEGATGSGLCVRRLSCDGRRLGLLVLRCEEPLPTEVDLAFGVVANLLAPELARADHRRAASQTADSARRFVEQIIDSLPVGLYVIDRDFRVRAWNRKRESGSQGISRDKAIGRTIFEILHRAPAEKLRAELEEVFEGGRTLQFHMETRVGRESRTYRISKIPMRVHDGGPVTHVITIGEDVTDWAGARDHFARSDRLALVGQLAAGILPEVEAPLAGILDDVSQLSVALEGIAAEGHDVTPAARILASLQQRGERGRGIIARLQPLAAEGEFAAAQVATGVERTLELLQFLPAFQRLHLAADLAPDLPAVTVNQGQLVQVLMVLLNNARDAMPGGGTVTVRASRGDSFNEDVVIEVIDEGHGIPADALPRIFEPFFSTRPPPEGTGLGLAVCHAIVSEHGGRIEVDTAVGAGSTFRIFLPSAEAL